MRKASKTATILSLAFAFSFIYVSLAHAARIQILEAYTTDLSGNKKVWFAPGDQIRFKIRYWMKNLKPGKRYVVKGIVRVPEFGGRMGSKRRVHANVELNEGGWIIIGAENPEGLRVPADTPRGTYQATYRVTLKRKRPAGLFLQDSDLVQSVLDQDYLGENIPYITVYAPWRPE
jgi:hypothetical protein